MNFDGFFGIRKDVPGYSGTMKDITHEPDSCYLIHSMTDEEIRRIYARKNTCEETAGVS